MKPNIFEFQDHREFLRKFFSFAKKSRQPPTRKEVAMELGISLSNLSMILAGSRKLSLDHAIRLGRAIGLSPSEQKYFDALITKGQAASSEAVVDSLHRMNAFKEFRERNPRESETLQYLTHWYYVAVREMSALPGFVLDAKWIKRRLLSAVPLPEIQKAIVFLLEHQYIERRPDGTVAPPQKMVECDDAIHRVALREFHREILGLASKSITECPPEERNLLGFTFSCSEETFKSASEIIEKAEAEIRAIAAASQADDRVYHVEFCLFPLVRNAEGTE